jgi:ubiquinone/menaquinone biosynthesis C-methylase UbiE
MRHDDDYSTTRLSTTQASLVCGVIGSALLREWYIQSPTRTTRLRELRAALDLYDDGLPDYAPVEVALQAGYAEWAATYDERNPMVELERTVVGPILKQQLKPGMVVLDAGCGTGRHASVALELGCTVIGLDISVPMLEVARARQPAPECAVGSLDALPIASGSIDFAVCGLALCHASDLGSPLRELRRVLKPGGRLVISDPHARSRYYGGQGFYGVDSAGRRRFVRNEHREASDWITTSLACGFTVAGCHEPSAEADAFDRHPVSAHFPEAAPAAFAGAPALWVWELRA